MNINIYETVFPRLATFLIDLSSFRKKSTEYNSLTASETSVWQPMTDELEDMLSLTASAILELEKRGICCGLIVPGKSSEDCCFQYPGKHGSSPDELLYSLAAIHYHQEDIKIPFWEIGSHFSMIGTLYIVVSSYSSITIEANGLSGLGHFAVLARNASDCDNTCPDKCFLFSDLLKADENSL